IFEDGKAIIIDYKTDDISAEEISKRAKSYFIQLRFYSYIVSRLFPHIAGFQLKLVFIKHFNSEVTEYVDENSLKRIKEELYHTVNDIRMKSFPKNLKHCGECIYAIGGKCIQN
ncbi:MAG TPA: PD-(D/E)XK nuclease family protein, partial [Ignavibacteriaceae bacterium]|nr:PD-(D/E)XK nuclease family protein [Ignavibacteriaceae bacterium]